MAYNNGYGKIIGCVVGVIVAICVIFVAAIGIKALATDTSFEKPLQTTSKLRLM